MDMKSVSHYLGSYSFLFVIGLAAACGDAPTEKVGTSSVALTGANGISADLVLDSQWGQGYCARVIVRNDHPSATTGSWSVSLDLGPGTTFTTWDGVFSGNTGVVTVTPQSFNAAIPPSASRQFGVCASTPSSANQPSIRAVSSDLPPLPSQGAVITEYKFAADIDPLVLDDRATELWASFYRPAALEAGRQYPLLVFMHGSHPTCGRQTADRRVDDDRDGSYGETGVCPATHPIVVPNHRGYDYIATDLAERGYFVLSINTNRGINGLTVGSPQDQALIGARGRLLLRHLERLSRWDAGDEATPAELGVDLEGRVDFSQVGLFGHSRGGNGVRFAYEEYRRSDSWPQLIREPVAFRGIFEIGPTDELVNGQVVTATDVPWTVLLPACDWDQSTLPGLDVFERTFRVAEATPSFKSFYHVWGANHNFYNTEWMSADANGGGYRGCFNHDPLFDPLAPGSVAQQETGRRAAVSFFTANVGLARNEAENARFDPAFPLPVPYHVDRGYHPGSSSDLSLLLEDFINPTGTSSYLLANETGGALSVIHGEQRALLTNIVASPGTFFQTNFAPLEDGFDLTSYDFLDVRANRLGDFTVPGVVSFGVELVNDDDSRSSSVAIDPYLVLGPPARSNLTLPTARIPLSAFVGAQLDAVRAVRFTFTTPYPEGFGVALANVRATRLTTPAPAASVE
jgi:hypothetical protein